MRNKSYSEEINQVEITTESIAQVIAAINGTGPRVENKVYRAHVPKYVTKAGEIVIKLSNEALEAITTATQANPEPKAAKAPKKAKAPKAAKQKKAEPEAQSQPEPKVLDLFDEVRQSTTFEPLITAFLNRNWLHFRAHAANIMGDFDPECDEHVGEPNGLVDRFFTKVYEVDKLLYVTSSETLPPTASIAAVIACIVAGDKAGSDYSSPNVADETNVIFGGMDEPVKIPSIEDTLGK
jgi:hypothetical protein